MNPIDYYALGVTAIIGFILVVDIVNTFRYHSRGEKPEGWRYAVTRYGMPMISPIYFLNAVIFLFMGLWVSAIIHAGLALIWYLTNSRNDDSWRKLGKRLAEKVAVTSDGRLKVVKA